MPALPLLNLGCGQRYHPDWTNLDLHSASPHVQVHDLTTRIPFPDESFAAAYHAHLLEHLTRAQPASLPRECLRVLRPTGVLRVAVPDLETICRTYLAKLERAASGDRAAADDYEWMLLELYDQMVRERSGGGMAEYLRQDPVPNQAFALERIGEESREINAALKRDSGVTLWDKLRGTTAPNLVKKLGRASARLSSRVGRVLERMVLGRGLAEALEVGLFRRSGEIHLWMYDSYSLAVLLERVGFEQPRSFGPGESRIPGWASFHLDALPDGTPIKPDSLYMEVVKPDAKVLEPPVASR